MRTTLVASAIGASAALLLTASTSLAAIVTPAKPAAVTVTDQAGDANALNGQGFGLPVPATATGPASYGSGDVLSLAWQTLVTSKKVGNKTISKPTGMKVTMALSGAPQINTIYRVTGGTAECTVFWFTYSSLAGGAPTATLQHNCPGFVPAGATGTSENVVLDGVKIEGSTITWTVPGSVLPKAFKVGTQLTGLSGHTRMYAGTSVTGGATVPAMDEAAGDGVYVYGK